jgi:DNA-directed RNA polymerase specialized sigma24 family protein
MTSEEYGLQYSQGFDRTVRFLVSRGVERDTAPDVAQSAWVRGWERIAQLREDRFVLTWVNTIALNVHRRLRRMQPSSLLVVEGHEHLAEFQTRGIDLAAIDLSRLLKKCAPAHRCLLEQQMQGVTAAEIAHQNGTTETAVRIRLLRARRGARSLLTNNPSPKLAFPLVHPNAA